MWEQIERMSEQAIEVEGTVTVVLPGTMFRVQLTHALVPFYLGVTASFFWVIACADETAVGERTSALEREFEDQRPYLLELWNAEGGR